MTDHSTTGHSTTGHSTTGPKAIHDRPAARAG